MFETKAEAIVAVLLVMLALVGGFSAWIGCLWWALSFPPAQATILAGAATAVIFGALAWCWIKLAAY